MISTTDLSQNKPVLYSYIENNTSKINLTVNSPMVYVPQTIRTDENFFPTFSRAIFFCRSRYRAMSRL